MDKYYVEKLFGEKSIIKTIETSFEDCEKYVNERLSESPRSKYRILKTHTDVVGEYTGSENAVPRKKILHCHICDKVMIKDEDPIYIHRREHGYYTTDTICCSRECALSAAECDVYKYSPEVNNDEYRNAGWYYQEIDC